MKINITKLLTIISFISFCIFFIVAIETYKAIYGALCLISIIIFYILLIIYLNETLDEQDQEFFSKYGLGLYSNNEQEKEQKKVNNNK